MYSILFYRNPLSQNNRNSSLLRSYRTELLREFFLKYGRFSLHGTNYLYGAVYYFTKRQYRKDADNISKPLWDALEERVTPFQLYEDDNKIKIRTAGTLNTNITEIESIDLTYVNGNDLTIITEFILEPTNTQQHLLYVEIGDMKGKMFKFDIERF